MGRISKIGLGALSGAVALALPFAAVAQAQQPPSVPAPPSKAQVASSPAVKRLKQLLEVVNSGDAAAMKAFIEANAVPPSRPINPGIWTLTAAVLDLHRRSHGLDLLRVAKVTDDGAIAVVRNRLTGDEQALSIKIEPQAPHRIDDLPNVPPPVADALVRPTPVKAKTEQARLQEIGAYLKRLGDAEVFSGAVLIARDGTPVFSHAYGYADQEKKIPNTLSTPFLLGSMNKLFTGLAIGQLVEQGKLSYDDPLSKFLPDFPDPESAKKIRIKHLLSHTSGLMPGFFGPSYTDALDGLTNVRAIVDTYSRAPLLFQPGTKYAYSNMGFAVLGRVIEIVTGDDYYDYMQKNVFGRAGTENTSFPLLPKDGVAVVPMAYPYTTEFDGERLHYANKLGVEFRRGGPSCCNVSSALDLLKLSNAIHAGRIVRPETLRLHSTPKPELGAPAYGYGFFTRRRGLPFVGHAGTAGGQCSELGDAIGSPYTIIVLSNLGVSDCLSITAKILQVLVLSGKPAA